MENQWVVEKSQLLHRNKTTQRILERKYFKALDEINRLEEILKNTEINKAFHYKENETGEPVETQIPMELIDMHERSQEQEVVIMKKEKLVGRFLLATSRVFTKRRCTYLERETAENPTGGPGGQDQEGAED